VPHPVFAARRAAAAAGLGAVVAGAALTGCAKMDAALSQQWVTVSFKANTTVATLLHVRQACSHVPNVTATPIHRTKAAIDMIDALRYDTTNATDANLAELQQCLQRFPSVAGLDFQDAGDSGD
jgi:hypothetical protein